MSDKKTRNVDISRVRQEPVLSQSVSGEADSSQLQLSRTNLDVIALIRKKLQTPTSSSQTSKIQFTDEETKLLFTLLAGEKLRFAGSGIKRFDYAFAGLAAAYANTTAPSSLCNPQEGDDYNNRIGRGIRLLWTEIRITGQWVGTSTAFSGFTNCASRFVVCLDKMAPLSSQWADNTVPNTSYTALMSTARIGTNGNTVAQTHYDTYGVRYHHIHDHMLEPPKFGTVDSGTLGTSSVFEAQNTKLFKIDWRHAHMLFYSSTATSQLENDMVYWLMQDFSGNQYAPYSMDIIAFTYFQDLVSTEPE